MTFVKKHGMSADELAAINSHWQRRALHAEAQIEQAARIADPWPGYPTTEPNAWGTKLTEIDKAVIAVRKEIAERIRSLSSVEINRG